VKSERPALSKLQARRKVIGGRGVLHDPPLALSPFRPLAHSPLRRLAVSPRRRVAHSPIHPTELLELLELLDDHLPRRGPMTWYYLTGNQPTGPVEETEIDRLFNHGSINLGTRVWRQGLQTWKTFAEAFNLPVVSCFKCKRLCSPDLSVQYGSLSLCPGCKDLFFQQVREGLAPETTGIYGGFWIRAGAYFIDQIALFLARLPFEIALRAFVFWDAFGTGSRSAAKPFWMPQEVLIAYGLYFFFAIATSMSYYVFFVGRYGATPGKMALKLRVVRSDLSKVSYLRALGRYFAQALSGTLFYLGYIMAGFDSEKRALHDYICDTRVIKRKPNS
jgi:uncharacterized RDD family membrane protein YckC